MKEIIFWFDNHRIRNYWLDYAINYCKNKPIFQNTLYNKMESWIQIRKLKILFKVNNKGEMDLVGNWDKNQYWVEELFDNNFEEFFLAFIIENLKNEENS